MGVMVGGEWHEELADPGGGVYESGQAYNQASANTDWGENLNTTYGNSGGGGGGGGGGAAGGGIDQILQALQAGDQRTFDEMVRQFSLTFGLDEKKFGEDVRQFNESLGITQAGLTGMYQGAPTLPALTSYATQFGTWGVPQQGAASMDLQKMYGQYGAPTAGQSTLEAQRQYAELYGGNAPPGAGQETLAAQQQRYAQQMGMVEQAAALQANPFRQQQAIGQMGNLLGGRGVAGFSAPTTVAGVGTAGGNTQGGLGYLSQMIEDIRNPSANTASMNEVMNAIPTPTKLNSTEFLRAAPSTQNMVLQGMQEKYGLDPQDALRQIQNTLPQFQAPTTFGGVKR